MYQIWLGKNLLDEWLFWKVICHGVLAKMILSYHKLFLTQAFGKQFKWGLQQNSANLMVEILKLHAWKIYPFNKIDHTGHHSASPIKTHLIHKQFMKKNLPIPNAHYYNRFSAPVKTGNNWRYLNSSSSCPVRNSWLIDCWHLCQKQSS